MRVRRFSDPRSSSLPPHPFCSEDEARNNLILGLAGTLRDHPGYYPEFRLWTVERGTEVLAAALQTPPFNLVLAGSTEAQATERLAAAVTGEGIDLPGVIGANPEVDQFADAWEAQRETTRKLRRAQRIYRLTEVRSPARVAGRPRVATADDKQLLVAWIEAFADEISTAVPAPPPDAEHVVEGRLNDDNSGFLLWEDGAPVSLAGWGGATPSGIRIGPVYTPPDRRSRGYGSAVTAAVSAEQLAAGRRFCFLYTDLANPTSNRIYMDIGYEPVCDAVDYVFEAA